MGSDEVLARRISELIATKDGDGLALTLSDERAKELLHQPVNDQGTTFLHEAAALCDLECIAHLLNNGALIDTTDNKGMSALMVACRNEMADIDEQAEVVQLLLARKANVLKSDFSSTSVLHYACLGGNELALELILDKGIDINAGDQHGRTPLHIAIEEGELNCAKVLIDAGADKRARDKQGRDAVHYAGSADAVNLLLGLPAPPNSRQPHSKREAQALAQAQATDGGDATPTTPGKENTPGPNHPITPGAPSTPPSSVQSRRGAASQHRAKEPDQLGEVLQTQLVLAVRSGDVDKVARLLEEHENQLDITVSHLPENWTPLHESALLQARECLEVLLDNGFSVHSETTAGVTPLLLACSKGDLDLAVMLLERGARVDATDRQGLRPLLLAAAIPPDGQASGAGKKGRSKKNGAGPGGAGESNFVPQGAEIVRELLRRGTQPGHVDVNLWNALHHACHGGNPDAVESLLARDPNSAVQRTKDGETPLHRACLSGSRECVELLLEQGTPIDAVDTDFQAPLHVAVQGGHYECVRSLLEYAADPNIEDKESQTPLLLAVMFNHVECAKALLDAGADVYCSDSRGYTLLDHAYENGSEKMFQILTRAGATSDGKLGYDRTLTKAEFVAQKMGGATRSRPLERHTVAAVQFIPEAHDNQSRAGSRASKSSRRRKLARPSTANLAKVYGADVSVTQWHPSNASSGPSSRAQSARRRRASSGSRPGTAPAAAYRTSSSTGRRNGSATSRPSTSQRDSRSNASGKTRSSGATSKPSVVKRPHEFSWENFSFVRDQRENTQLAKMMDSCHCSGNRWMPSFNCVCQERKAESKQLEAEVKEKTNTLLAKLEKYLGPDAAKRRMAAPSKKNVSREAKATQRARKRRPVTAHEAHIRNTPNELRASPYGGGRGVLDLDEELPFMLSNNRGCHCGRARKYKNSTCVRCLLGDAAVNGQLDFDDDQQKQAEPTRAEIQWQTKDGRKVLARTGSSQGAKNLQRARAGQTQGRAQSARDPPHRGERPPPRPASQQNHRSPRALTHRQRPQSSTAAGRPLPRGGARGDGANGHGGGEPGIHRVPSAPSLPRGSARPRPRTAGPAV